MQAVYFIDLSALTKLLINKNQQRAQAITFFGSDHDVIISDNWLACVMSITSLKIKYLNNQLSIVFKSIIKWYSKLIFIISIFFFFRCFSDVDLAHHGKTQRHWLAVMEMDF